MNSNFAWPGEGDREAARGHQPDSQQPVPVHLHGGAEDGGPGGEEHPLQDGCGHHGLQ